MDDRGYFCTDGDITIEELAQGMSRRWAQEVEKGTRHPARVALLERLVKPRVDLLVVGAQGVQVEAEVLESSGHEVTEDDLGRGALLADEQDPFSRADELRDDVRDRLARPRPGRALDGAGRPALRHLHARLLAGVDGRGPATPARAERAQVADEPLEDRVLDDFALVRVDASHDDHLSVGEEPQTGSAPDRPAARSFGMRASTASSRRARITGVPHATSGWREVRQSRKPKTAKMGGTPRFSSNSCDRVRSVFVASAACSHSGSLRIEMHASSRSRLRRVRSATRFQVAVAVRTLARRASSRRGTARAGHGSGGTRWAGRSRSRATGPG